MGRAVVIGGSIAGSLAAAALANHFDEIVVLDRDSLPEQPQQRNGVPQGHHYHALLGGGRARMNQLLPGFSDELVRQGAPTVSVTDEIMMRLRCGWTSRFESDLVTVMASRPLIEFAVRKLAREIPNVVLMTATPALHVAPTRRELLAILEPEAERVAQAEKRDILEVLDERERSALDRHKEEFHERSRRRVVEESFGLYRRLINTKRSDYPDVLPQRVYQPIRLMPCPGSPAVCA